MNTFARISSGGDNTGRRRARGERRSSKDIFFVPLPGSVRAKQTGCKFPHCFPRAKGFPLCDRTCCTRALCLHKMYLFFRLFVAAEKLI